MKGLSTGLLSIILAVIISTPLFSQDNTGQALKIEKTSINDVDVKTSVLSSVNTTNSQVVNENDNNRALITVLPNNGGTSGNGRAPQGTRLFQNARYIIGGDEMTASGFTGAITSVGWSWNTLTATAQSVATTGNLKVFIKDTVGTATSLTGTYIDTTGAGYTKIIDGTISIPAGTAPIQIDVPVGGPGTSSHTPAPGSSVILIFVYKTTTTLATPVGAPTIACNATTGRNGFFYFSNSVPGAIGSTSIFRPETRFGNALVDAIAMGPVWSLGEAAVCPCPNDTNLLRVNMFHNRTQIDTVIINTKIVNAVGGSVKFQFEDTIITGAALERWLISYLYPKVGDVKKTDSIITTGRIIGSEDVTENNRATYLKKYTLNRWNHAEPTGVVDGGVGFTGATGDFVAGFYTSCSIPLTQVNLGFFTTSGGSQPYNVKVFAMDDDTLKPGALLHTSSALVSPPADPSVQRVTYTLPSPVMVGPGYFYVGIAQTGTTNIAFAFQSENPIRSQEFFFTSPVGSSDWTDFADAGANFRLDIAAVTSLNLQVGAYLEGFFNGNTMVGDTIRVVAHSMTSPYLPIDTASSYFNTSGIGTLSFNKLNNDSCYIFAAKHRNHIRTWSHLSCEKIDECDKFFDYRNLATQTFGSNVVFVAGSPGGFAFYGGEVIQDGFIDLSDITAIFNDAALFTSGYVITDCNGDDFVDLTDITLAFNNATNFVGEIAP